MPPAYPSSSSSAVSPRLPSSSFTSTTNNLRKRTTPLLESSELPPQLPSGDDESVFELDFSSIRPVNASPDPGKSPTFSIAESLYPTIRFVKGVEVGDGAKEGVREEVGAEEGGGAGMERVDTGTTVRPAPYRSGSGGGNFGLRRAPSGRVEVGGPRPAAYTSTAMNSTPTSISYCPPPPAPSSSSSTYPVSPLPAVPFLPPAQSLRLSSTAHRPQPAAAPLGRTLSSTSSFSTSSSQTSSTNTHSALSGLPGSVLALASSAAKVIMELEKTLSNQSFESEASSSSSSSGATITPAFVSPPPVSVAPQRPAPAPTRAPPPSAVAQRPLSRPRPGSSLTSRNSCSSSSTSTLRPHSQPPPHPSQRAPPPPPLLSSNPPLSLHPHHILPPVPSSVPLSRYGTHGVAGSLPIPEKGYTLDPLPGGGGGAGMDMEERVVSAPGRIEAGKMRIKAEREVPPVPAALRAGRLPVPSYEQELATFPRRPLVLSEHLALATHVVGRGFGLEGGTGLGRGGGGVRPPTASSQRSSGSGLTRAGSVRSAGSRRKPLPSPIYNQPSLPPPPPPPAAAAPPRPATTASTSTLTLTSKQGTGETVTTEAFGLSRHKNREERLAKRAAEEKERGEEKWTLAKWGLVGSSVCVFSCSLAGLICALATYNKAWEGAEVALLVEAGEFGWLLATSVLLLPISLLGLSGALLNSRPLLAWYTFLLWPLLAFLLISSYTPYRRFHQNLEGKLDEAWSRAFSPLQRNLVQEVLGCCGYYNAWHDAAYSAVCYPRTPLPGCKGVLLEFERRMLLRIYRSVFVVVGVHVINMTVGLLASNHVDRQFGRRLLPPAYRLTQTDVHPTLLLQAPAMQQRSSSYASSSSSSSYLSHQSPHLGKPTLKQLHLASYRLSRAPSSRSTQSSGSTYSTDSSRTGRSKSRSRMGELPKTPGLSGLGVEVEGEPEVEGWTETPVLGYDDGRRRGYRRDQRGYEREVYEEEEEEMKGGIRMVG